MPGERQRQSKRLPWLKCTRRDFSSGSRIGREAAQVARAVAQDVREWTCRLRHDRSSIRTRTASSLRSISERRSIRCRKASAIGCSAESRARLAELRNEQEELKASCRRSRTWRAPSKKANPLKQNVFIRGDYNSLGEDAPKAFPLILAGDGTTRLRSRAAAASSWRNG